MSARVSARGSAVPMVLSVAGSDPSGGAGVQADLKTFAALGVHGGAAVTALTVQSTAGVRRVQPVPAPLVVEQVAEVLDDVHVAAVKIGVLPDAAVVAALAGLLAERKVPHVVLDPVLVATSGDALSGDASGAAVRTGLLPLAHLVTPNLPETGALLGEEPPGDVDGMTEAAARLAGLGGPTTAVLVKGGHLGGDRSPDVLALPDGSVLVLDARRVPGSASHGTGCTLSSACAALLAHGRPLVEAVTGAKAYVAAAVAAAGALPQGRGPGPVHHFYHWWGEATAGAVRAGAG